MVVTNYTDRSGEKSRRDESQLVYSVAITSRLRKIQRSLAVVVVRVFIYFFFWVIRILIPTWKCENSKLEIQQIHTQYYVNVYTYKTCNTNEIFLFKYECLWGVFEGGYCRTRRCTGKTTILYVQILSFDQIATRAQIDFWTPLHKITKYLHEFIECIIFLCFVCFRVKRDLQDHKDLKVNKNYIIIFILRSNIFSLVRNRRSIKIVPLSVEQR